MAVGALLALTLFVLHAFRLYGWYHRQLWQHVLLWSLYLAYAWITLGFLLVFLSAVTAVSPWVAVHAFAYGGIGLITLGMMARVTLGHTGRNVFAPPVVVSAAAALLVAGTLVRVVCVMLWPAGYDVWILTALLIWIAAFALSLLAYLPMLLQARVDRRYG
ncbi:MAG: NnrS family protein [Thiolinea sp.]